MGILSQRTLKIVTREYNRKFGIYPEQINVSGRLVSARKNSMFIPNCSAVARIRAYSLQEAVRWGEAYVFNIVPGVVSWVIPLVNGPTIHGGLLGGEVIIEGSDVSEDETSRELALNCGINMLEALQYARRFKRWHRQRVKNAALYLYETFYQISGWQSELLEENRVKAHQQQQISDAITQHKLGKPPVSNIDRERMLLYLIRSGERSEARRVLNEMLAAMYLFSPKLPLLRARAIEMMGYLTRAAIEDSAFLEPLIIRNHEWMERLIKAPDFETLSHVLMRALDDFMDGICLYAEKHYNTTVGKAMAYITAHYKERVSLKDVAQAVNLSPFRISHVIKEQTGKTIIQHVIRMRINKAREMLEKTDKSCSEIAYEVGFCDQSDFIRHFRKINGTTPARYRRAQSGQRKPDGLKNSRG